MKRQNFSNQLQAVKKKMLEMENTISEMLTEYMSKHSYLILEEKHSAFDH